MKLKLDVKTLIIGIGIGVIITAAIGAGYGSADADRFGIAIPQRGYAVVSATDGGLYVINAERGMAVRVLLAPSLSDNPTDTRSSRGKLFNLGGTMPKN